MTEPNARQLARNRVAELLPRALEAALVSYEKLLGEEPQKPKEMKEYHAAQKACLAHIEHLLKLMPPPGDDSEDRNAELAAVLEKAKKEIQSYEPLRY